MSFEKTIVMELAQNSEFPLLARSKLKYFLFVASSTRRLNRSLPYCIRNVRTKSLLLADLIKILLIKVQKCKPNNAKKVQTNIHKNLGSMSNITAHDNHIHITNLKKGLIHNF